MYTGEVDLTNTTSIDILELLIASDELFLKELFNHVQDYLVEKRANWIQKNFVRVLHSVFKLASCKKLQDYCLESICADPLSFFTSNNFLLLNENILYSLLQRNDLQIEEIVVWDSLIKWGIIQTPGLGIRNSDRTKWNNENYEALKKTLDQFIPLIWFVEMSPTEYFDKVRPYKAVIPNHIYEEIEEFYFKGTLPRTTILPPRVGKFRIDSNIIKPKLSNTIINWIERKDSNYKRNKKDTVYNFGLIYRRSRDGNNMIQNKCAGQGAILILIKIKHSEKIFGGYNPIGWNDWNGNRNRKRYYNQYLPTTESFIFSFENNENMKISRVINSTYAIYNYHGNGINFGGGDLALENDRLSLSYTGNYENLSNSNMNNGYGYNGNMNNLYNGYGYNNNMNNLYNGYRYNSNQSYEVEEIEAFRVDVKLI
jgi:hypothetical protein